MRLAFFPPHSGRLRRLRRSARPLPPWAASHTDCFGWHGAVPSHAYVQFPTPATAAHLTRLWLYLAITEPAWPVAGVFSRRRYYSARYNSHHSLGSDRPGNSPVRGTFAVQGCHNADKPSLLDVEMLPATSHTRHPI